MEAVAREARYAALAEVANRDGREIWVAHTREDQAETLLLGALRGNPVGMAPVSALESGLSLVRPFLMIRRADTAGACEELGLDAWHDPMNNDLAYQRVSIRKRILPALAEVLGGNAVPALARTADRIAADQAFIEQSADLTPTADCNALAADPAPIRQRRIMAWLREQGISVSGAQLADVERLCTDWRGQGPVTISGGVRVERRGGGLNVDKQA